MKLYQTRKRLASAIIRFTCRYISDTPIRALHTNQRRFVGNRLAQILAKNDDSSVTVRRNELVRIYNAHARNQRCVMALYRTTQKDTE